MARKKSRVLAANIGNFHTLAFRLQGDQVERVFEHHTGLLDRENLRGSSLRPYYAAPLGDMMITGCYSLLAATAEVLPDLGETIWTTLGGEKDCGTGKPP